jgi:hypothetical protein
MPSTYAMAALTTNAAEEVEWSQTPGAVMAKGKGQNDDDKNKGSGGQGGGGGSAPGGGDKKDKRLPKADLKGEFSLTEKAFENYPKGKAAKPKGPFRILEGDEYAAARAEADAANRSIHAKNPMLKGKQIHEVHPVKFGGSPTDPKNKIALSPTEHQQYTTFWRRLLRLLRGGE